MKQNEALIIHGERVKRIPEFPQYVASPSGRFYRTEAWCKREIMILDEGYKYVHETKLTKVSKGNKGADKLLFNAQKENGNRSSCFAAVIIWKLYANKKYDCRKH